MPTPSETPFEVEGFYIESLGPVSDEFVPDLPMRVLFGRSGAGKSSILYGLTQACSGLHSLSRQRVPVGGSGLILRLKRDEVFVTPMTGLEELDSGTSEEETDHAEFARCQEKLEAQFDQRIAEVDLDPMADGLHLWTAAALIGDDSFTDIAVSRLAYGTTTEIDYPVEGILREAASTAVELAGGRDGSMLIHADDRVHLRRVTNAFLNSRNLLLDSTHSMSLVLDVKSLDPEVADSLGYLASSMERAESSGYFDGDDSSPLGRFIPAVSPLYYVAQHHRNSSKRWLSNPTRRMEVNVRERSEFFGPELDRAPIRAVYLGGDVEQSIKDFETALTDAMPVLHDRLLHPLLLSGYWALGSTEEELTVARSGLLAPMSPHRSVGSSNDPWLEQITPTGGVEVRQTVRACCVLLANRANELLPEFLQEHGEVVVSPRPIGEWTMLRHPRIEIHLDQDGSRIPLESVGSGIRRWLLAVVDWAYQELLSSTLAEFEEFLHLDPSIRVRADLVNNLSECTVTTVDPVEILIVDEPELHLDPRGQLQVAEWLKAVSRGGTSVVLASHSPAFLTYQLHEATLTAVVRASGLTTTADMSTSLLEWCRDWSDLVGLTKADKLLLSAGFIFAKDRQDWKVLRHFFSTQLAAARIELLHLYRYINGEQSLIDFGFLVGLGKPIGILLNDEDRLALFLHSDDDLTPDELALQSMWQELERYGVNVIADEHPYPDVMCALPEDAVIRAFPEADFPGWEELEARYNAKRSDGKRNVRGDNFKTFALREMNLEDRGVIVTAFIDRVLSHCPENAQPRKGLQRAVNGLLAPLTA